MAVSLEIQREMCFWASNQSKIRCKDVFEAEAKACLIGLKVINDISNISVVLESDNAGVVDAINR